MPPVDTLPQTRPSRSKSGEGGRRSVRPDASQPTRRNRFIHETLRDNIRDGRLPDGLVLTESALARLFEVSRAPAADALERLAADGLVSRHGGRGYLVGDGRSEPVRMDLERTGLRIPRNSHDILTARSARDTLYPRVEREVASAVSYGAFTVAGPAMARHFGVSRTTAQEVLSRLQRVGVVEQAANGRWIAPRLTANAVRDHYQIRHLLEPVALVAAVDGADGRVAAALDRIAAIRARDSSNTARAINAVESDLHERIVLACPNVRMRETLRRSQLPLIATHAAFDRYRRGPEMARVLDDHGAILVALRADRKDEAAELMRRHLEHGERTTLEYMRADPRPPRGIVPSYMERIDD